ncbi:glycosyltransferase [Nitrosopumilus sp. SJ]|uniref:glycosyltransferase n=1 Tax=Nitrosopumilus sp. SJ TaxID=1027374 RepID=UPI000380BE06|nr:glycosyltransferase [Nitrosopumilus sp. SJ]
MPEKSNKMIEKELISVLIPVFKIKKKLLIQSISSILEQSYQKIEVIVIFEKSNSDLDKDIESVLKEKSKDSRLKVVLQQKKGIANSLNEGINEASGELIARMDADDISEKNRFEEQEKFLRENNLDLIGSWATSISENNEILGTIEPPTKNSEIRKKIMFHNPFLHPSIMFRKKIIEKIGTYNTSFNGAEDYDLYFRVISNGFKVGNIPKPLIRLRETTDSVMRGKNWRKNRKINFQVKKNAVKNLGFNSTYDLIYFLITPLTFFVSPKNAFVLKNKIGYNRINQK